MITLGLSPECKNCPYAYPKTDNCQVLSSLQTARKFSGEHANIAVRAVLKSAERSKPPCRRVQALQHQQ